MIPEVFECPRCERQFVIDSVPDDGSEDVHCPQCSRYLGVRDVAFVLRTELDEMIERLTFEKDRLETYRALGPPKVHNVCDLHSATNLVPRPKDDTKPVQPKG